MIRLDIFSRAKPLCYIDYTNAGPYINKRPGLIKDAVSLARA